MSSTNQQLRDGIKGVAEMLEVFPLGSHMNNCAHELRKLLDLPADDPTDTERLEWLMETHDRVCRSMTTRESIDAAMHPNPKYRPWTLVEARHKCVVVAGVTTEITITGPSSVFVLTLDGWRLVSLGWLLDHAKQPDGSPCGVEVH